MGRSGMSNPALLTLTEPLDMEDARAAYKALAEQRKKGREGLERAFVQSAEAEAAYRKGLAQAFVVVEGATAAEREARAREKVADLSYERDLKSGLIKVAQERLHEVDAHRQSLNRLVDWSRSIDPLAGEQRPELRNAK